MPGSGKSSTGRSLATFLDLTFIDTDEVIVKAIGKTIPDIFATEGEEAFRRYETQALESVAESEGQVVGTGGGIVTQEINWELMRGSGQIVYLDTSVEWILKRTQDSAERPLLNGGSPEEKVEKLYNDRQDDYQKANNSVNTDGKTPEEVASEIQKQVQQG